MEAIKYNYIDTLEAALSQRQKLNPQYSLRSFARDLGVHPATLSMVFNRKRELPKKNLSQVIGKLNLTPIQETLFRESFYKTKTSLDQIKIRSEFMERAILDERYYKIIAEWEYYALLTYLEMENKDHSAAGIAREFGIAEMRVCVVLRELEEIGFIQKKGKKFIPTIGKLRTTEDVSSRALRESHKETLDLAKQKLDEVEVELRDFSSMTIAVDPVKLPEAKTIIREFRQKLGSLLRDGERHEVYQFAIQLFPLTNTKPTTKTLGA